MWLVTERGSSKMMAETNMVIVIKVVGLRIVCHKNSKLDLLPLIHTLEFYDFINALKQPSSHFNIYKYVSFGTANARSSL